MATAQRHRGRTAGGARQPAERRVAIYTRLSRDPDGTETATARQAEDCRRRADAEGWKVIGEYRDADLSAFKRSVKRPGFEQLLADAHAGIIDAVMVWRLDRFARQPRDLERFLDIAEPRRIDLISVTEPITLGNGTGLLMTRILAGFASHESQIKSERIRRKMVELAESGAWHGGGTRPYGYNEDRLTVRSDEAKIVRAAAKRILAGESLRSVAGDLNRRKIPTVTGTPWTPTVLRRILTAARTAGFSEHPDVGRKKADWAPIISEATLERLRAILLDPRRDRRGSTPIRKYLLTGGLLVCGECGIGLVARPKDDKRRAYVCAVGAGFKGCGRTGTLAEPAEKLAAEAVFAALASKEFGLALMRAREEDAGEDAGSELAAIEHRLAALEHDHYVEGLIDSAGYQRTRAALDSRRDDLRARVAAATGSAVLAAAPIGDEAALRRAWESGSLDWRRALFSAVFERMVVNRAVKGRNFFDPNRFSLVRSA